MNRLFAAAAALVFVSTTSFAATPPEYDAFYDSDVTVQVPGPLSGPVARRVQRGQIAHVEERLGVPTFFWANQDPARPSLRALGLTAEQAARRHLFDYAGLYRHSPAAFAESLLDELHDTGRGAIIATFTRRVNGVPVFRDAIHVIMDRELRLVALTGYTSPHAGTRRAKWNLSRATAIATAFFDLTGQTATPRDFVDLHRSRGGYESFRHQPRGSFGEDAFAAQRPVRVKDVLFGLPDALVPAYYLELDVAPRGSTSGELYAYVISAVDGRLLFRHRLSAADSYNYRVWAESSGDFLPWDGPQGSVGTPHPTGVPDGYQAPFVAPNLVTLAAAPFSRTNSDPWLPSGASVTTGNNVEAYADRDSGNGFTASTRDVRGTSTGIGVNGNIEFGDVYDVNLEPDANAQQINAAIVSLFYVNNFLHDWYYDHGFDEAAGNAQASNFGRGGVDGDAILAEAQDYSGTNNANMDTPADGDPPRMQQYLFSPFTAKYLEVLSPPSIAGQHPAAGADFGAQAFDLTGDVVFAADGSGSHAGCAPYPAGSVTGKLALVDRGGCTFAAKAQNAIDDGAAGLLVANTTAGVSDMGGALSGSGSFPALMISQSDGAAIKAELANGPVSARMYRESGVRRDGTIDNLIVAHEWAHYLSNRLIGDANGLSSHQGLAMGEGWSDFNGLVMAVRESDAALPSNANYSGVYASATYVESGGGNQGYYFGIRRVPYSTDLSKNGLTFGMIADGVPLSPSGGNPAFPVASGASGSDNSEVHASGEVWCTMLWEGYAALLNATSRYTFLQAQNAMKDYFVASLKATPNAPTMLEARDALLAVVYASNAQDFALFTAGFAKRGAGIGAVAPARTSQDHTGVVESFLSGGDAVFADAALDDEGFYCDHDGILDDGETGYLVVTLKNQGWVPLDALGLTVTSNTPGVTVGNNGQVSFAQLAPYAAGQASVPVTLGGVTGAQALSLELSWTDPAFAVPGTRTRTVTFSANFDEALGSAVADDVEAPTVAWTFGFDPNLSDADQVERVELGAQNHAFQVPDPASPADVYLVSPPLDVATNGNFTFTFQHAFQFERTQGVDYDGGILELSVDAGATWTKIPQSALQGQQYNVTLDAPGTNPLAGQLAFGNESPGYPNLVTTTVDLGSAYAGQTVQVRFRAGGDDALGRDGWFIDDLAFTGITNTPFNAVVPNSGICVNRPPIADAGADQQVDERTEVVLDGSGTTDPDGDQVALLWQQTAGPSVVFTAEGTFTAPEVQADETLTFELRASDGQLTSAPAATHVLVRQVNRKPTAVVPTPFIVEERTQVTLDGSQSFDVDGDAVAGWQWSQVSGPMVTLSDETAAAPTFTAPEVMMTSPAVFELVVTDGELASDPVQLEVTFKQVNRAPVVTLEPQGAVDERSTVTLAGAGQDPDGEDAPNLHFEWSQVSGPFAELQPQGATLTLVAPEVTEDAPVSFRLRVYDGDEGRADRLYGEASVTFTVKQVNRSPVARAGTDRTAAPGTTVGLGGPTTDADADKLTYTWKQVEGPEVHLLRAATAFPAFEVPPNAAVGTKYTFELTVSDGLSTSEPDSITITVALDSTTAGGCGCQAGQGGSFAGTGLLLLLGALALIGRRRIA